MGNLISRQAAIHALCKAVHKGEDIPCENQTTSCLWTGTRVCDFVREIDALPPIQPEPHWIPVGERLPEEYGEYLVTKRTIGWNCEEYDVNDIAYFDDDGFHKADRIIAWMPLPTPYTK